MNGWLALTATKQSEVLQIPIVGNPHTCGLLTVRLFVVIVEKISLTTLSTTTSPMNIMDSAIKPYHQISVKF